MDLKLTDKTYMVAASSKGLGFGIAEALAQEGAKEWFINTYLALLESDMEIGGFLDQHA